ncbi:hypothetical protein [Mangrovihabitans endophyticus]|uniref:DUF1579 domain-containing protein n=1 Tax=Mangrovihabitans endophyticus TaxID=1751298 RepID=A0A8J3C5D5_9ACTN|nr:hypothetical protein [Mangrovihabitans endophyticus]GGL21037.1 hypothetical protein GCM10012284_64640 [Mangrovihabitans endophyticus]
MGVGGDSRAGGVVGEPSLRGARIAATRSGWSQSVRGADARFAKRSFVGGAWHHPGNRVRIKPKETAVSDGRADFDFIFGRWRIRNRKLREVTDPNCAEWVEFDAVAYAEPILGGLGHVDRMWAEGAPGEEPFEGFTLRQFDPQARVWRIWWASSRRPGHLDPPVEGAWHVGTGTFDADDVINERPVKVRFEWTSQTPDSARWQQKFSYDQGQTWRTNWVMDLSRVPADAIDSRFPRTS